LVSQFIRSFVNPLVG